jgi:lipopolysaccharide/colanic/teichoic acid biosynthesis glycosyltransferase
LKRFFDIFFSLIIILFLLPLGLIIILILKTTGEREVFYTQQRVGKNNIDFGFFKFVTMLKDSPNIGSKDITLKEDPRVLPIGRFLRKTKINEFPQFINVFLGDMSIVGPRPLVRNQYIMIPEKFKLKINLIKPGITGIGSIIFRDEEKYLDKDEKKALKFYKEEIVPFKAELECWYYDNKSMLIDMLIICITCIYIFLPKSNIHNYFFTNLPKHPLFNPLIIN